MDSYDVTPLAIDVQVGSYGISNFGSWMAAEQQRVFLLCRRLPQDVDEADSATQDIFLKAYRALNKGKGNGDLNEQLWSPAKWVTRIAVNTCFDRLRSKSLKMWRRRPSPEDEEIILGMTTDGEPNAERLLFFENKFNKDWKWL
jgi:DNA-directed RNA polymerase specialized sigma24 family protein